MPGAPSASTRTLSEADSATLLAVHGVPMVASRLARSADEAAVAAIEVGVPAAAKLCGDSIAHKTERGLVRLKLGSAEAVREAASELLGLATPEDGEVAVLVAPMVAGNRELIAGLATDPQFGRTVLLGVGGILAEAVADVSVRLVPIDRVDGAEMIEDLATQALLGPFRGEPAVDREALIDVLVGLSAAAEATPGLVSADVNPLIVADGRPVAVDALVELEAGSGA